jgi:nitrogen fixation NifU-like protein
MLEDATDEASEVNPLCGDEITLYLKVKKGLIEDVRFVAQGCALMNAAASVMTEDIKNKELARAQKLDEQALQKLLNTAVSGPREKCLALPLQALRKINDGKQ